MAARQWRTFLLAEFIVYVLLGAWLVDHDRTVGQAIVAALALFLAIRALPVAITYAYTVAYSSPVPASQRIGPFRFLRMVMAEYLDMIALFSVIQPFERFWMRPDRLRLTSGHLPLLLLHGYQCNRGAWFWLRPYLEAAGWTVATHNLEPVLADIDGYAEGIERRIDEVLAATQAPQVILVCHSMGGLAARAYLRRYGMGRIARVITLATPHQGSRLGELAWGRNGKQLRIGNPWLVALAKVDLPPGSASIYSVHDNHVMPQRECSELPGARNVALAGIGHLGMLFSPAARQALLAELAAPPASPVRSGFPASSG
jgi:triacylglycerol lipase